MKIAITGSTGLLGKNLFKVLSKKHEVFGISRKKSDTSTHIGDITEPKLISILNETNPEIIVHTAALTNVEKCEVEREEAHNTNVQSTRQIAQWTADNKRKLIYISTDYIYPGTTNNYNESSEPDPLNYYGLTKLEGELETKKVENHLILRPTGIFGYDPSGLNFLMQLLNLKQKRKIPIDLYGNPTDVKILCDYIEKSIKLDLKGEYIATGPETMNRYEFSKLISRVFELDEKLMEPVSTSELNLIAKRPLYNGTNSSKLRNVLNHLPYSLEESLNQIKKLYENE